MMPVFSYADGEKYFGVQHPAWVGLYVSPGQAVDSVLAQVQTTIQPFPGALALRPNSSADLLSSVIDRFLALLNALLLLAVFVAALGVVNTMTINVAERRREIALLRAVGATQRQIRTAIVAEAATLGFMAALIAIGVSLLMLGLFVLLMTPGGTPSLGIRVSWDLAAIALEVGFRHLALYGTLTLLLGPLAAALAAYYPARQAAAQNIIAATGADQ
jgi:putative ABC transport system permease protein